MQTLVEDFLQYLRHERGQSAGNKRRDAEDAENRRNGKKDHAVMETTLRFSAAFAPLRFSGL